MNSQFRRLRTLSLTLAATATIVASAQGDITAQGDKVEEPKKEARVPVEAPVLKPLEVHPRTSLTVVEQLRYNHYVKKPLDDGISSDVFDKYLDTLDGGRAYFLAADIVEFEQFRYTDRKSVV